MGSDVEVATCYIQNNLAFCVAAKQVRVVFLGQFPLDPHFPDHFFYFFPYRLFAVDLRHFQCCGQINFELFARQDNDRGSGSHIADGCIMASSLGNACQSIRWTIAESLIEFPHFYCYY